MGSCGHVLYEQPPEDLQYSSAALGEQRQASHDITASSNLVTALDRAVLDGCDIMKRIPNIF
eukprot:1188180-Prorocentrum_minimum.AAC.2